MKIGFSGTRAGMSEGQKSVLRQLLKKYFQRARVGEVMEFHHGGCTGADLEAGEMAHKIGYDIVIHPGGATFIPDSVKYKPKTKVLAERPNLKRNQDIVNAADVLFAAPLTDEEQQRSGTWATIRAIKRSGKSFKVLKR